MSRSIDEVLAKVLAEVIKSKDLSMESKIYIVRNLDTTPTESVPNVMNNLKSPFAGNIDSLSEILRFSNVGKSASDTEKSDFTIEPVDSKS